MARRDWGKMVAHSSVPTARSGIDQARATATNKILETIKKIESGQTLSARTDCAKVMDYDPSKYTIALKIGNSYAIIVDEEKGKDKPKTHFGEFTKEEAIAHLKDLASDVAEKEFDEEIMKVLKARKRPNG